MNFDTDLIKIDGKLSKLDLIKIDGKLSKLSTIEYFITGVMGATILNI